MKNKLDVFDVGAKSGLFWALQDLQLAGLGNTYSLKFANLVALAKADPFGGYEVTEGFEDVFGSGPVAFGALPFKRDAPFQLFVPQLILCRNNDRVFLTVLNGDDFPEVSTEEALSRVEEILHSETEAASQHTDQAKETTEATSLTVTPGPEPNVWKDQIFPKALKRITAGDLDKVVLARQLTVESDSPLDKAEVLGSLRHLFPTSILFSIDGFVGASPEMLVSRLGDEVSAHPLAGTVARGADAAADKRAIAELLMSEKNGWEHKITIDWLLDRLLSFCSYVDAEPEPTIVELTNVYHLGTRVFGRLSRPAASVVELVAALHPTPAVAGSPQERALALIEEIEPIERNRYAGPVGWFDYRGNGAFAVGIRSAQIAGTRAVLNAGVGVVSGSDAESELAETSAKFRAMLSALGANE